MGGVESSPEEREKPTEDTQTKEWKLFGSKQDANKKNTENVKNKKTKKAVQRETELLTSGNPRHIVSLSEASLPEIREDVSLGSSVDGAFRGNTKSNQIRFASGPETQKPKQAACEVHQKQHNGCKATSTTTKNHNPDGNIHFKATGTSPAKNRIPDQKASGQICKVSRCHHVSVGNVTGSGSSIAELAGPNSSPKSLVSHNSYDRRHGKDGNNRGSKPSSENPSLSDPNHGSPSCRTSATSPKSVQKVSEWTAADIDRAESAIALRTKINMAAALQSCNVSNHNQISLDSTTQSSTLSNQITPVNSPPSRNTSHRNTLNLLDLDLDLPEGSPSSAKSPSTIQTCQKAWLKINRNQKIGIGTQETEKTYEQHEQVAEKLQKCKFKGVQESARQKRQESFNKQRELGQKQERMEKLRQQALRQQQMKHTKMVALHKQQQKTDTKSNMVTTKETTDEKSSINHQQHKTDIKTNTPIKKETVLATKKGTNMTTIKETKGKKSANAATTVVPKAMRWMSTTQTGILPVHIQVTEHEKKATSQATLKAQLFSKPKSENQLKTSLKASCNITKIKQLPEQTVRFLTGLFFRNRTVADIPSCVMKISKPLQPGEVPVCFLIREHREEFGIGYPSEDEMIENLRIELHKTRYVAKLLGWNAFQGSLHHFYRQEITIRSTEFPRLTSCTNKAKSETTKRIKIESTAETSKLTKKQKKRLTKARNKTEKENEARLKKLIYGDPLQKNLNLEAVKIGVCVTTLMTESKRVETQPSSNPQACSKQLPTTPTSNNGIDSSLKKKIEDKRTNEHKAKVINTKPSQPKPFEISNGNKSDTIPKLEPVQFNHSSERRRLNGGKSDRKTMETKANANNVHQKTGTGSLLTKKLQPEDKTKATKDGETVSHKLSQNMQNASLIQATGDLSLNSSGDTNQGIPKRKVMETTNGKDVVCRTDRSSSDHSATASSPMIPRNIKFTTGVAGPPLRKNKNRKRPETRHLVDDFESKTDEGKGSNRQLQNLGKSKTNMNTSTTEIGDGKHASGQTSCKLASGPATSKTKASGVIKQDSSAKQASDTASCNLASGPAASTTKASGVIKQSASCKQISGTASSKQVSGPATSTQKASGVNKKAANGKQASDTAAYKHTSNLVAPTTKASCVIKKDANGKPASGTAACKQASEPKTCGVIKKNTHSKQQACSVVQQHGDGKKISDTTDGRQSSCSDVPTDQMPARPMIFNQFGQRKLIARRLLPTQTNTKRNKQTLDVIRFCLACADTKQPDGKPLMRCTKCEDAFYCSRVCLTNNWTEHQPKCKGYRSKCNRCLTFQKKAQS